MKTRTTTIKYMIDFSVSDYFRVQKRGVLARKPELEQRMQVALDLLARPFCGIERTDNRTGAAESYQSAGRFYIIPTLWP